ncbi:MAG: DUF2306 domain-containing protein [Rhodobacteraceae bacterium]|nr:DUF2306 domain-containing protein [Paracoccaceae bacterium]
MPKSLKTNWRIVVGLLLLGALPALPAGYIVSLLVQGEPHEFVRPIYSARPFPIAIHAVAGVVFWLAVPLQFSTRVRLSRPRFHKGSGRAAMLAALVLGLSSFWLMIFNPPVAGWLHRATLGITGAGTIFAFAKALCAIKNRKIAQHRAWVMRAVAIVYGASTTAFVAIPVYLVFGQFPEWMEEVNRLIGLLVNLILVEWWLRRKSRAARHLDENVYNGIL